MSNTFSGGGNTFSRRALLGGALGIGTATLLAACSPSGGGKSGSAGSLKFWDMTWGTPQYNVEAKKITTAYVPAKGQPKATYQTIQWDNYAATFASAIASKTGPAVSSGGGSQAFQFADQGAILYADGLIESFKKSGFYDDFLPGSFDYLKTAKGYVAIPWNLDPSPLWYRKSLLDKAGVEPPATWDEWLTAGKALKKIGVYGFGTGAGSGNLMGYHSLLALMINNGGGFFDADGNPDCVTDANIEAMDFLLELVGQGVVDPGAISYTQDNVAAGWKNQTIAIGYNSAATDQQVGAVGDVLVASPPTSTSGKKGGLMFGNNLMMYTNTPSKDESEAFLTYYMQNIHKAWDTNTVQVLPVLNSIVKSPAFQKNTQFVKIVDEWVPVSNGVGAVSHQNSTSTAAVESGTAVLQWAQTMLQGKTDSKAALTTLQAGIEAVVKKK